MQVGYRSRLTRQLRWEMADENITYDAKDVSRNVVAKDPICLIVRTFRDRLFTEIFPGRTHASSPVGPSPVHRPDRAHLILVP